MGELAPTLSAKAKLAASRADLIAAMGYELTTGEKENPPTVATVAPLPETRVKRAVERRVRRGIVANWWHRHPLSGTMELAQPFLQDYARRQPAKLMAYSAGAGAALWLLKPWRLLPAWTIVGLLVKTTNLPALAADLVSRRGGADLDTGEDEDTLPPLG